jgi:hypothetical protein
MTSSLKSFFQLHTPYWKTDDVYPYITPQAAAQNQVAWYLHLKAYVNQNGLYDVQTSADYAIHTWDESMKSIRTCASRAVEFHADHIAPGNLPAALPIVTANDRIIDPIQKVWKWSNLSSLKQVMIRQLAGQGDLFIYVTQNTERTRVYFQVIEPMYITEFSVDERGNLTMVRVDTPIVEKDRNVTRTEIWDANGYRLWKQFMGFPSVGFNLGSPQESVPLSGFGIDFVPFVHAKFKDVGELRGDCCFMSALDKIDEANRIASRLHQMLFRYNKPIWAVSSSGTDPSGRPLPPPALPTLNAQSKLEVGDDSMISLPGMTKMESLVPAIDYAGALAILRDHVTELERDLPELAYSRLHEQGNMSGKAIRLMLSDAVSKAKEARGNFEQALSRADQMALTIGSNLSLWDAGSFDAGDFDHSFQERDILPLDESDRATTLGTLTVAGIPLAIAMKIAGYSQEIIDDVVPQPIIGG